MNETTPALTAEAFDAIAKVESLKPSQATISESLPEENAVEVVGVRGEKRIDYKGIKIKNADGTPNKYAKRLVDMHRPAAELGSEVTQKLQAGDYALRQQPMDERERRHPISPALAERIAKGRDFMRVHGKGGRFRGREVRDWDGVPNLWLTPTGSLVRILLIGTRETQRVEVVSA